MNCTCGVELVEGARFCHKCGRPVDGTEPIFDEPVEPVVIAAATPPPLPPPIPSVGFQNRTSIRTAITSAVVIFISSLAFAQVFGSPAVMIIAPPITGLLAVILLVRRAGHGLTAIEGARQGWISGLFFFIICLVLMTLLFLFVVNNPDVIPLIREQAKAKGTLTPDAAKVFDEMQQPGVFAGSLLMATLFLFVSFTALASLGGMVGSRLFGNGKTRPEIGA